MPGYPSSVVVCGDQQTYSIMKNLIVKYPETFTWMMPMPGDWHLAKLAAETIRDMLWDDGLHDLAKLCGHHKELYRWKDVHRILLAVHESLTYELVKLWQESQDQTNLCFEDFIKTYTTSDNSDEISKFWARTYEYLTSYFGFVFAIRSGNWHLRNASIPKLSELFFCILT